jgi:hypothetical protein
VCSRACSNILDHKLCCSGPVWAHPLTGAHKLQEWQLLARQPRWHAHLFAQQGVF